jgi:hypothetical protein
VLKLHQLSALVNDGLAADPSPAFLWVSADAERLQNVVYTAAQQIVQGAAPDALRDRRLVQADAADLLAALQDADLPPIDQMEAVIRELEESGAALALTRPELLGESDLAFDPADVLCDALAVGRIGCFIGLTDPAGLDRLSSAQPRLLMLMQVSELDTGSGYRQRSLTLQASDTDDVGWLVVVRCQLLASVDAIDELVPEQSASRMQSAVALDELGIDRCMIVPGDAPLAGVVISVRHDASGLDEESKAERIALAGTRRLIQRPLGAGERLEVTRLIYLMADPDPA